MMKENKIVVGAFEDTLGIVKEKLPLISIHTKTTTPANLPLRGFLICPQCERMLTGSASKGRKDIYYYYHCTASCGCRFKAEVVNEHFASYLKCFKPFPGVITLYKTVISSAYKRRTAQHQFGTKQITEETSRLNEKLAKARDLVLSSEIDPSDYRVIKANCEENLNRLEAKLIETSNSITAIRISIDKMLEKVLNNLSNLDNLYLEADSSRKRRSLVRFFQKNCVLTEVFIELLI